MCLGAAAGARPVHGFGSRHCSLLRTAPVMRAELKVFVGSGRRGTGSPGPEAGNLIWKIVGGKMLKWGTLHRKSASAVRHSQLEGCYIASEAGALQDNLCHEKAEILMNDREFRQEGYLEQAEIRPSLVSGSGQRRLPHVGEPYRERRGMVDIAALLGAMFKRDADFPFVALHG